MKSFISIFLLLIVFSCKEKIKSIPPDNLSDSTRSNNALQDNRKEDSLQIIYVERARHETGNYLIVVTTKFEMPKSLEYDSSYYFNSNYVLLYDKATKKSDTLALQDDQRYGHGVYIQDVTKSVQFENLLLSIVWPIENDWYTSYFIEYSNNHLKELFAIADFNNSVELSRKDKHTLTGFITGRDEVVNAFQTDYPVIVSLKDYEVQIVNPEKQHIGYLTEVDEDIIGYTVSNQNDTAAYTIKSGSEVVVDTLYRFAGIVTLIVTDSLHVRVAVAEASSKLRKNAAG